MIGLILICLASGVVFASGFFLARWLDRKLDDFERLPLPDDDDETPRKRKYPSKKLSIKKAVKK